MKSMSWDVKTKAGRAWGRSRMGVVMAAIGVVALLMVGSLKAQVPGIGSPGSEQGPQSEAIMVASPTTFGTRYWNVAIEDFLPWGNSTWNTGSGRYPVSGDPFMAAALDLPHGSKITELEFYYYDNDGTFSINRMQLFRERVDSRLYQGIAGGSSSGSSSTYQTLVLVVPSTALTDVDRTLYKHILFVEFGQVGNANLGLAGARIGYTGPAGNLFLLSSSDRFVDTRPATTIGGKVGPFVGISGGFDFFDFTVTGVPGRDGQIIPTGSTGVVGNVTAIGPTATGLFKILPGGTPCTTGTSTVNFNAGVTTANAFNSGLNASGELRACFGSTTGATSHLTIDVVGATQ